jgi:hypothetical protein
VAGIHWIVTVIAPAENGVRYCYVSLNEDLLPADVLFFFNLAKDGRR